MASSPADSLSAGSKKRKRVSRACDACFAKKDRCDGHHPVCAVCANLGRRCTYDRPERKRGPSQGVRQRLEGQVESLESILGFLVSTFPQISHDAVEQLRLDDGLGAGNSDGFANSNGGAMSAQGHHRAGTASGSDGPFVQHTKAQARDIWRNCDLAKTIAPSLGLKLHHLYFKDNRDEDEDEEVMTALGLEEARRARQRLATRLPWTVPQTRTGPFPPHIEDDLDHHLDHYFNSLHTLYPFVDKPGLLRWSSSGSRASASYSRLALVLAICASSLVEGDAIVSDDCHGRARELLMKNQEGEADIEAVQSWLLLAMVDVLRGRSAASRLQLSTAIQLARDVGIGTGMEIAKLLWWSLFCFDVFLSLSMDRAPVIRRADFSVPLPVADQHPDEWSLCVARSPSGVAKTVKAHTVSTFCAQAQLCDIMHDVALSKASSNPSPGPFMGQRLHAWRDALPPQVVTALLVTSQEQQQPQPFHIYHLALLYHTSSTILHPSPKGIYAMLDSPESSLGRVLHRSQQLFAKASPFDGLFTSLSNDSYLRGGFSDLPSQGNIRHMIPPTSLPQAQTPSTTHPEAPHAVASTMTDAFGPAHALAYALGLPSASHPHPSSSMNHQQHGPHLTTGFPSSSPLASDMPWSRAHENGPMHGAWPDFLPEMFDLGGAGPGGPRASLPHGQSGLGGGNGGSALGHPNSILFQLGMQADAGDFHSAIGGPLPHAQHSSHQSQHHSIPSHSLGPSASVHETGSSHPALPATHQQQQHTPSQIGSEDDGWRPPPIQGVPV